MPTAPAPVCVAIALSFLDISSGSDTVVRFWAIGPSALRSSQRLSAFRMKMCKGIVSPKNVSRADHSSFRAPDPWNTWRARRGDVSPRPLIVLPETGGFR